MTKKAKKTNKNTAAKAAVGKTKRTTSRRTSAPKPQSKAVAKAVSKTTKKTESRVGKVYRGVTKYIDVETKPKRNYLVVKDTPNGVTVAKLKSIKKFDEKGRNADKALQEINQERYGLTKRTGVDFERFDKNRIKKKALKIEDKDVFPDGKEEFKLGSKDLHRALIHTKVKKIREQMLPDARSELCRH